MAETTLKQRIRNDMNDARRQQDRDRARLLSTVLSDLHNREIELQHELSDAEVVEVLGRGIKKRTEAAEMMASRPERAQLELNEIAILKGYMPAQVGEEEIRKLARAAIAGGAADVGAVMGRVMPQLKGRAEGREVNRIVREELEARRSGD
jgi:uncharacterized protein YqeY